MSDEHRTHDAMPLLRIRSATMLTALGLCLLAMILQLGPQLRAGGLDRLVAAATASLP